MPRFYFDFQNTDGILRDDDREELASAMIARKVALETIGALRIVPTSAC